MRTSRIIFATLALIYFLSLSICTAQNAQNTQQAYLKPHNDARARVRVRPLRWNDNVANYARNYANKRKRDCRPISSNGPYGENIATSSGDMSIASAVKKWVDEKRYYNYQSNSCVGGRECKHYTQVVWSRSNWLGCARVRCNNGGTFVTCNYSPRGNRPGQRPYQV